VSVRAENLAVTEHDLAPGHDLGPYRYDYGNETWLLVTAGRPTIRHAEGEEQLEPGDLMCLPAGPGGAYQVSNHSADPVRMLRLATQRSPTVVVFPDTENLELTADDASVQLNLPRAF
jgi:uncharacterized cupin superfamily protein